MKLLRKLTFILLLFYSPFFLSAQNNLVFTGQSQYKAKVSFSDIEKYDKENPPSKEPGKKRPNKEIYEHEFVFNADDVVYKEPIGIRNYKLGLKDPSPLPDVDFLGLEDNNSSIPPDVNGAVGPDHLMITLNTEIRIMDKAGNEISTIGTGSFWYPMPGAGDVFDPKIIYDPYENRWILVMPSSSNVQSSALFVAVSETTDPTGNWFMYSFDSDPDNEYWFDYPSYGFNKKWIAVSGNMFGAGFGYNVLFVIDKQDLYNGLEEADYNRFTMEDAFTVVPAYTYDADEEDLFMVMNAGGNTGGYGYLQLFKVTGEVGNEVVENIGLTGAVDPWESWSGAPGGNLAPQMDSDENINSGDGRIQNVIFRNGKLWCAHHIFLPLEEPERSAIQWWELATDGTILQRGRVDDTTGLYHFTFPTIAVNAQEDIMIGYSSFSEEQFASCSYSFRYATDPQDVLRDRYQFKEGLAPYFKTFGGSRNRWGDYSGTIVDPYDDLDFWTLQEFADTAWGGYDHWSTWWAKIKIDAVPEADFEANITSVPVGSQANFTDLSKFEPDTWQWIFEGGTPATSSEQNPADIFYNTEGDFDVTLIVSNALGSDTVVMEDYINANFSILPEVSFSISDTLPCMNQSVVFTDNSVYNPVEWLWEFQPDDVTFVNGTSASSQNPEVMFIMAEKYSVSLTATNLNGSNTLLLNDKIYAGGVYLPFGEDFESKSFFTRSWEIDNPDNNKTWEIAETGGNDAGMYSAFVNLRYYNVLGEKDRLITPLINLSGLDGAILEFEYAYAQRFPQFTDSLIVYVSTGCDSEWIRILELAEDTTGGFATHPPESDSFFPEVEGDWCGTTDNPACHFVDLTAWIGNPDIRIIFEAYAGFGNNLFIDNVQIRWPEGIDLTEMQKDDMQIYPNPSDGRFILSWKQMSGFFNGDVHDLTGRKVHHESYFWHGCDM
ncbi:MAG: PKD domain-containing protein, partial [Bacteroidales bacterium]|nr:PKD domain-containing protein [Bacteroidales bacterium]